MFSSFVPRGLERASDSSDPQFKVVSLSLDRGLVGLGFDSRDRDSNSSWERGFGLDRISDSALQFITFPSSIP